MQINTLILAGEVANFKKITDKVSKISIDYYLGKDKQKNTTEFSYFGKSEFNNKEEVIIFGEVRQKTGESKTTGKPYSITDLIARSIKRLKDDKQLKEDFSKEDEIPF